MMNIVYFWYKLYRKVRNYILCYVRRCMFYLFGLEVEKFMFLFIEGVNKVF